MFIDTIYMHTSVFFQLVFCTPKKINDILKVKKKKHFKIKLYWLNRKKSFEIKYALFGGV